MPPGCFSFRFFRSLSPALPGAASWPPPLCIATPFHWPVEHRISIQIQTSVSQSTSGQSPAPHASTLLYSSHQSLSDRFPVQPERSEERRVGKECRGRQQGQEVQDRRGI